MSQLLDICLLIFSYFLGTIPSGRLSAAYHGIDIRKHGSGNVGATNVTRVLGEKLGALVWFIDLIKGYLAILLVEYLNNSIVSYAAVAVVYGHILPVWTNFKGGRGVATFLGVLFALKWYLGFSYFLIWLTTFMIKRISGLASCTATLCIALYFFLFENFTTLSWAIYIISIGILVKHRTHILEYATSSLFLKWLRKIYK